MNHVEIKTRRRERRRRGIRRKILGVPSRPRMTVFRSGRHIYAQLIDDLAGHTLAAASSNDKDGRAVNGGNCEGATAVGKTLAERARKAGIDAVVFDRNGYRFHGRVKALADGAREAGLKF